METAERDCEDAEETERKMLLISLHEFLLQNTKAVMLAQGCAKEVAISRVTGVCCYDFSYIEGVALSPQRLSPQKNPAKPKEKENTVPHNQTNLHGMAVLVTAKKPSPARRTEERKENEGILHIPDSGWLGALWGMEVEGIDHGVCLHSTKHSEALILIGAHGHC